MDSATQTPKAGLSTRRDLARLLDLYDQLRAGSGGVVLVEGPRGVGKAALLAELRRELSAKGQLVLLGRAEQSSGAPYAALRDPAAQALTFLESRGLAERFLEDHAAALGVLLPSLQAHSAAPHRDKLGFFEALRTFFLSLAELSPPTLLLADLHYADGDTLELVRFLAAHLFQPEALGGDPVEAFSGVLMLACRTDDENGAFAIEQLRGGREFVRLPILGFGKEEFLAYLETHPALTRLLEASRGRPEDIDELLEALPASTDALLAWRVSQLPPLAQRTLEALTVIGRPASPGLLAMAMGEPIADVAQALSRLVEARLLSRRLHNGELLFAFTQPHHQESLRAAMPPSTRANLHLAVGIALEALGGGPENDAQLAYHFLRGSEASRGVSHALRASERLLMTFAYGSAAELLARALPHVADDERVPVLIQLVEAERLRGRLALARNAAEQLLAAAPDEQRPHVLRRTAEIASELGEHRRALEVLTEALEHPLLADREDLLPERAQILAAMAEASYALGDFDDAMRQAEAALQGAPSAPIAFCLRIANTRAKVAYAHGRFEEAERRFLENLGQAELHELEQEALQARVNTGLARFRLARYDSAREILERALGQARALGDASFEAQALLNLGAICQRTSDIGRAIRHFQGSLSLFSRMGKRAQMRLTAWNLANVYAALGLHTTAETHLQQSKHLAELDDSDRGRAFVRFTEADLAFDQRRFAEALSGYDNARVLFEGLGERARVIEMSTKAAWAALRLGDLELAQRRVEGLPVEDLNLLARARVDAAVGATLASGTDPEEVARGCALLMRVVDVFLEERSDEDAWRALAFLALRYRLTGDPRSAENALDRAREILARYAERLPAELKDPFWAHARRTVLGEDEPAAPPHFEVAPAADVEVSSSLPQTPPERRPAWDQHYGEMVGRAPALLRVFDRLDRVSRTRGAPVLIRGESGTGKELVAAAIHRMGDRQAGPFVRVNCAALVETLLLSELFGHEKGSFTGAFARKIGRFEMARGGTLFLDEIGDISPKTQVSLLRVLQEKSFERVGGTQTISTDAAVICATHRDLEAMVADGSFREDLYYRLRGLVVELPPLRDRAEDIPALVAHVLDKSRRELGRAPSRLSEAAAERLMRYPWPGNIRELENVIRSVSLFCEGEQIEPHHLAEFPELFTDRGTARPAPPLSPPAVPRPTATRPLSASPPPPEGPVASPPVARAPVIASLTPRETSDAVLQRVSATGDEEGLALGDLKRRLEFEAIASAMRQTGGNVTKAAALLKMKRPRLSQIVNGNEELKAIKEQSRGGLK